VYQRSDWLFV